MKYSYYILSLFCLVFLCISCKNEEKTSVLHAVYQDQHRPQFHFSPQEKWMNDPNGMVYFEGEYHLFYQYYPDSTVWGPMHWGHAVSADLVHWEHLPIALYPDSLGMIFSGSAVVDWNNTSGFGKGGQPPLVAIFTYHNMEMEKSGKSDKYQYQGIAYSTDKGRTWKKYAGNPVIPNPGGMKDFRDPKVVWDTAHNQWLMVFAAYNHTKFYCSKDLKSWQHLSDFGLEWGNHDGIWECPDFFPMAYQSATEKKPAANAAQAWVLLQSINPGGPNGGSATQYFVGNWDGKQFTLDSVFQKSVAKNADGKTNAMWLDYGRDNYAGVTWSDIPSADGRRLFLGWMSNWDYAMLVPTERWRSAMTIPRSLTLQKTENGPRLFSNPVEEIYALQGKKFIWNPKNFVGNMDMTKELGLRCEQSHVFAEFVPQEGVEVKFILENSKGEQYSIGYDGEQQRYFSDRTKAGKQDFSPKFAEKIHYAPRNSKNKEVIMELFIDRSSCELFADAGATNLTDIFFPTEDFSTLKIVVSKGQLIGIPRIVYSELNGIW